MQREPKKTMKLVIRFERDLKPWEYNLALNGREVNSVWVDGVRYVPVKVRDWDDGYTG